MRFQFNKTQSKVRRGIKPGVAVCAAALLTVACGQGLKKDDKKSSQEQLSSDNFTAEISDIDESIDEGFLALSDAEEAELLEEKDEILPGEEEEASEEAMATTGVEEQDAEVESEAGAPISQIPKHRTCVDSPSEGKTTVTIHKKSKKMGTILGENRMAKFAAGQVIEIERVWSRNGQSVGCNPETQRALIDRKELDGVELQVSFKRRAGAKAALLRGDQSGKAGYLAEGTRSYSFSQKVENGLVIRRVEIESHVTRKAGASNSEEGVAATLEVKTVDQPLVLITVRNAETFDIISRTIESGTTFAQRGNGATLTLSFENVQFAKGEGCLTPVSGTVSGSHVKKSGEEREFEVNFAEESGSLKLLKAAEVITQRNLKRKCASDN